MSEFDAATAVERTAPGVWRGAIHDGWDIGGFPNGGYVMALVLRAALEEVSVPDPLTVTAHYLAPPTPGSMDIDVELVRSGRRHETAMAAARQGGRDVVRLLTTCTDLEEMREEIYIAGAPPDLAPPERCVPPQPGDAFRPPPITERVDLRLGPEHVGFAAGRPPGVAEVAGWARFADGRAPDAFSLVLFADAFPPAVFNADLPMSWVPTVELTVQVRRRPAAGWLRGGFRTRFVSGRYLEEDGELWDSDDHLVALSRQLAVMPRPPQG